ncbi:MAG TPA: energy transducer TonB [Hymenobacter sp.]|jgi:TonB family protein|nr:energy transducer TonB [Hymenobacter sp.]
MNKFLPVSRPMVLYVLALHVGLVWLVSVSQCFAQRSDSLDDETVFTVVEKQPEFTGGMRAFGEYLTANLRYPERARAARVEGKVFVHFIVRKDGRITDVGVLKGIGFGCDEEAIRVISAMPNWRLGSQSGRPVNVKNSVVVRFSPDSGRDKGR